MDAYDLIISILALKPRYSKEFQRDIFCKNLLEQYPKYEQIFNKAKIKPHQIYRDSPILYQALDQLTLNGILKRWFQDENYTWDFPLSPSDYFKEHVKPKLNQEQIALLGELAVSMR